MKIEALRIQNYKMFQDITLKSLLNMYVFLGANGSGKSTFFDIFIFLKDALTHNVRQALARRGGFREVVSRNQTGPIIIELKFREVEDGPLITYRLQLGFKQGQPVVETELLSRVVDGV